MVQGDWYDRLPILTVGGEEVSEVIEEKESTSGQIQEQLIPALGFQHCVTALGMYIFHLTGYCQIQLPGSRANSYLHHPFIRSPQDLTGTW